MKINDVIIQTASKFIFFIILAFSLYVLFKGHNNPGGGFIGGLMTSAAILLLYLAFDAHIIRRLLPFDYIIFIGVGLFLAALTGIGSFFYGVPFLTHAFGQVELPILGIQLELASAMLFDIGVYLTVVGVTLTIITTIGEDR